MNKIRVLIVDDSALMRKFISEILNSDNEIEVVGTAVDGRFVIQKIKKLKPDIITLDVEMPGMNGLDTLKEIMKNTPVPVIMLSAFTKKGADITIDALENGAMDFIKKPNGSNENIHLIKNELIDKIKFLGKSSNTKSQITKIEHIKTSIPEKSILEKPKIIKNEFSEIIIAMGISTGGPQALTTILPTIPADIKACFLIVQHMPEGFTKTFAERLNSICEVEVIEAKTGDVVKNGRIIIARGDFHLKLQKRKFGIVVKLDDGPPVSGHKPSVDVLFNSVAENCGNSSIGVIMTGMGHDGVNGLEKLKKLGNLTIAQDEKTSVVFGMPKVAINKNIVDLILPLNKIVPEIISRLKK